MADGEAVQFHLLGLVSCELAVPSTGGIQATDAELLCGGQ